MLPKKLNIQRCLIVESCKLFSSYKAEWNGLHTFNVSIFLATTDGRSSEYLKRLSVHGRSGQ